MHLYPIVSITIYCLKPESAEAGCFDTLGSELEKLDRKRCQVGSPYKILDVCNITLIICKIKYTF